MKARFRSENQLLPFETVEAAANGDIAAINSVLAHFEGYIQRWPRARSMMSMAARASTSTRN